MSNIFIEELPLFVKSIKIVGNIFDFHFLNYNLKWATNGTQDLCKHDKNLLYFIK
jgi:hypothetical protein